MKADLVEVFFLSLLSLGILAFCFLAVSYGDAPYDWRVGGCIVLLALQMLVIALCGHWALAILRGK